MQIVNDIRESVNTYIDGVVFNYGRKFDHAIETNKIEVDGWFVHLDPITLNGKSNDGTKTATVNIGFLKQDNPDSEYDDTNELEITPSIEILQSDANQKAVDWLNYFLDNYHYSDGNYTLTPATRIVNVMSGCLMNVSLSFKQSC